MLVARASVRSFPTPRISRSLLARLLLAAASVVCTLLAVEFLLFPLLLRQLPLRLHVYLHDGIRPLAQSSKAGVAPRDWIALVGDSYAQGRGDWLLEVDADRNPPFHSAHVIRDLTGRDVVSLARGGAGSLRGLVAEPLERLAYLRASPRFRVEPPRVLIAYFYEGNDLRDTLLELAVLFGLQRGDLDSDSPIYDVERFRSVVEAKLVGPLRARAEARQLRDVFPFLDFVRTLLAASLGRPRREIARFEDDLLGERTRRGSSGKAVNVLRVAGAELPVSEALQGPMPDLSEAETRAALHGFEQSLRWLVAELPEARSCVVFVPSPASSYEVASATLWIQGVDGPRAFAARAIAARNEELRRRLGEIALRSADAFVDATPELRRAATREVLHGPRDWWHFNRRGYQVLGSVATRCLDR